jgi:hypothetical protein
MATSFNLRASLDQLRMARWLTLRNSAGINYSRTTTDDMRRIAGGLPPGATSGNQAMAMLTYQYAGDRSTAGVYVESVLGIANRVHIPLALRWDAGSALGAQVRPKFPKLSFSYALSDEPWFRKLANPDHLSTLRLRVAYGQAGTQPVVSAKLRQYAIQYANLDGSPASTTTIYQLGNPDLRPERTQEMEGGFDLDALDDRITLSMTWYRKRTRDALMNQYLPPSVGLVGAGSYMQARWQYNIGTVDNTGSEISISARLLQGRSTSWTTDVGYSRNRNVLVKLGQPDALLGGSNTLGGLGSPGGSASAQIRYVEGYPINGWWVRPVLGYADLNGDGMITRNEVQLGDSTVFVGAPYPKYTMSLHNRITLFRSFVIGASFKYEHGLTQTLGSVRSNLTRAANDPTLPLNAQAYLVAAVQAGSPIAFIQTVSTFRFDALSVGYNVPTGVTRALLPGRALRVSVQGTNLGMKTNYRGKDPNVNSSMSDRLIDTGQLPRPRVWQISMGIN